MEQTYFDVLKEISNNLIRDKILGISIDTIFNVSMTLFTVFLSQYFIRKYDKIKDKKSQKDIRTFFFSGINNLLEPVKKEILNIRDLILQIKEENERDYIFQDSIEMSFDFYEKINNLELFRSLTKYVNKKCETDLIRSYSIAQKSITSIENYKSNKIKNFYDFNDKLAKYKNICSDSFKGLMEYYDDIYTEFEKTKKDIHKDEFMGFIFDIIVSVGKRKTDIYFVSENIIMPIIEKYHSIGSVIGKPIITKARAFYNSFSNYKKWKELNILKLENQVMILETSLNNLEKSKEKLEVYTGGNDFGKMFLKKLKSILKRRHQKT